MEKLRLGPRLIPSPLWGISAAKRLKKSEWNAIRKDALAAAGNKCSICNNSSQRLFCHEEWTYDEDQAVATLTGFVIVCPACSGVIHFGRSQAVGYHNEALEHMRQVNGISTAEAEELIQVAIRLWKRQSQTPAWRAQVQPELLGRYPALARLANA